MATRLPAAVVMVAMLSLAAATFVGVRSGSELGLELSENQLVALRASGTRDIAGQVRSLTASTSALASSPQNRAAVEAFDDAFRELQLSTPRAAVRPETEDIVIAYQERYLDPLTAAGANVELRDIISTDPAALTLQYEYGVDLGVIDEPISVDDARDGSTWSEVHAELHPVYRDIVDRLDLFDLYLIEPDQGTIVYSASKGPDLGTSLDVGPFSGSYLAGLIDQVRDNPDAGVHISDLSYYVPAVHRPVAAVAAPILDGNRLVGILALAYDAERFTRVLTADYQWDDGGFPATAQSYMFGSDGLLRSEHRGFVENRRAHLDALEAAGDIDSADRQQIAITKTAVLVEPVADADLDAAEASDLEVRERTDVIGRRVLATVERVPLDDVDWYITTEVTALSAEDDLDEFVEFLIVGAAVFILLLTFLAVGWAARIVAPLRAIGERLQVGGDDHGEIVMPERSPIEFRRLAHSFEDMRTILREQRTRLADSRRERLRILRSVLPPQIAARVESGESEASEDIPQASVGVLTVSIERNAPAQLEADRLLIDAIHNELDTLGARHGVDRIKVVGDAYYASCGHARPYIDHAPRVASFVLDALDVIDELGRADGADVQLGIGIATGAVHVGVSTRERLLYDVWGAPMIEAHHIARRAEPNTVLAGEQTRSLLPRGASISPHPSLDGVWVLESMGEGS